MHAEVDSSAAFRIRLTALILENLIANTNNFMSIYISIGIKFFIVAAIAGLSNILTTSTPKTSHIYRHVFCNGDLMKPLRPRFAYTPRTKRNRDQMGHL
ncbi:hypothetical protein MKX08_008995 [Trichoderma sp. CBMAI-0020]|nr:hypothetical protein MKX08_008995 [Trichoderma sp. CBMAI-0020]